MFDMKKLFVLISILFLIGTVSYAQDSKKVNENKKAKIELKADKKVDTKSDTKNEVKDVKVEVKEEKAEAKEDKAEVQEVKYDKETAETPEGDGPEITFKETNHDFGEIQFKGNGSYEFVFVNTGNEPLILTQPKSSCGCTVPEWPRQPILPGESNVIKVTYKNTDRPGNFNKYVTVFSNALVNKEVRLHIKGTVLPEPTDAAPLKIESVGPVNKDN